MSASETDRAARSMIIGSDLVGLGLILDIGFSTCGFFLVRDWLPQLDFDWFWPLMLIGLGVLLLVLAVGRRPSDPGAKS